MKRFILLALAALIPIVGDAQTRIDRAVLMVAFDLDGEAADADQVIVATALVDNGTSVAGADWTIVAQPDTCRLLDVTIVDTNMTAGSIMVTGTGCVGESRICTFSFTGADDTGVKTLTCTDSEGAYFASVDTVTTDAMTGESDETFALGYTSNSVNGWAVYGKVKGPGPNGEHGVDVFGAYEVGKKITTAGLEGVTVVGVTATDDPFEMVSVGDIIIVSVSGTVYERKVTARASADQITVNQFITIPAAGATFKYKKLFFSTNPADDLSFPTNSYKTAMLTWSVDANANTGGVVTLFECTTFGPEFLGAPWVSLNTSTIASGATQVPTTESVSLTALPYNRCRFGVSFGSGDDADAAAEDINATVVLMN